MPLCSFLLSQCTRRCQVTDGCASPWPSHKYQAHEKAAYWSPPPSGCLAIFPCSSHSLCQNEWGIIHVGVSVCGAGQQDLGMAKAGCAETPKPFWSLGCHLRLRGWHAICTSGSYQVAPALQKPLKGMCFVERLM